MSWEPLIKNKCELETIRHIIKINFLLILKGYIDIWIRLEARLRTLALSKSNFFWFFSIFAWFEFVWFRLLLNFSPKAPFRRFLWLCRLFNLSWVFSFSWVCILSNIRISSCSSTMFEDDGLDFLLFQFLRTSACYACEASNSLTCETFQFFDFFDVLSRHNSFVIIWENFCVWTSPFIWDPSVSIKR